MKKLNATIIFLLVSITGACAGPLFDDYLNYVRPGTGTGPGKAQATASAQQPLGQSFTVPANTGEIYRIGVRPVYDTWVAGEKVTMTLYDSPQKKQKLGEYVIDEATCHVDQYVIGNGSEFNKSGDRVLYFQFRKPTNGATRMFFELAAAGGDGKVAFYGFDTDAYAGGEATGAGTVKDLAFECDIKPIADGEANLRKFFTERLDISRPELAEVKAAVDAGDWEKAIAETVRHFHNRRDIWDVWEDEMEVKINPKADTSTSDLLLRDMVRHAKTKEPIPWRKESWWMAEIPSADQPNHGIDPPPFAWHFGRTLGNSYTETGKAEYARKAIDLMMQFILDNPNPKVVYGTDRFPHYFEIWNDRGAAARTPGHGDLVYARLYNFPGWSNDEKMIFFSWIEDNARWVYRATSGANWGMEAARAAVDFGVKFPEWKMSPEYRNWGAKTMIVLSREDVRRDGTSTEAAIKYHGMVARRLFGLMEHVVEGNIQLDQATYQELLVTLNGMYDHMAYTLQPKGYVVMCGDSWYENYAEDSAFSIRHLKDAKSLAIKLREGKDPVSAYLKSRFEPEALALLNDYDDNSEPSEALCKEIVKQLNLVLRGGFLYDSKLFANVKLRDRTKRLLELNPHGDDLQFVNKWLIEDAYPNEIIKGYCTSELYKAGAILKRDDFIWIASQGEEGNPPTQISKLYPEGGYFIMRSGFDGPGRSYTNAVQAFIHNAGWWGSHGHWDFTSINLYGFGRTLIIDPGQYTYTPPPGIDSYWNSKIHSMMVMEGRDVKREPGPSDWVSNGSLDWFDGRHYGYNHVGNVDYVRRRMAYIKPNYFLVDDSAKTTRNTEWTQVWNLTDPYARFYQATGTIDTSFASGGNVMILNQDHLKLRCTEHVGITASDQYKETTIFRLRQDTDNPRFQSLIYPYEAGKRPNVNWERILSDNAAKIGDLFYSVRVESDNERDWAVFGECGKVVPYRAGKSRADADFALVRLDKADNVKEFSWAYGREIVFNGVQLAKSNASVLSLVVRYVGDKVIIDVQEPHSTLGVWMGSAKNVVMNGNALRKPVIKNGICYPFADQPLTIVADDRTAFVKLTETIEWATVADTNAYSNRYTHHETDPGRHENGDYVFEVPEAGTYTIEVHVPRITMTPSDRVEYRIKAVGIPAKVEGAIVDAQEDGGAHVLTVNHQSMAGWVKLGDFTLKKGKFKINAKNVTEIDGIYFTADAMRLVQRK